MSITMMILLDLELKKYKM